MARRLTAGALGAIAFLPIFIDNAFKEFAVWVPQMALVAAALLIWHGGLGSQLVARATWWANLLLGGVLSFANNARGEALWLAACCGLALLAIDDHGVAKAKQSSAFAPSAFTGTLMLAMLLALADTQTLLLFTAVHAGDADPSGWVTGVAAVAMIVSFVGLFRIKTWGVIANIVTNLAVATLALADALDVPDEFAVVLFITACIQVLLPVPMLLAHHRGRDLGSGFDSRFRRWGRRGVVLTGVLVVAVHTIGH